MPGGNHILTSICIVSTTLHVCHLNALSITTVYTPDKNNALTSECIVSASTAGELVLLCGSLRTVVASRTVASSVGGGVLQTVVAGWTRRAGRLSCVRVVGAGGAAERVGRPIGAEMSNSARAPFGVLHRIVGRVGALQAVESRPARPGGLGQTGCPAVVAVAARAAAVDVDSLGVIVEGPRGAGSGGDGPHPAVVPSGAGSCHARVVDVRGGCVGAAGAEVAGITLAGHHGSIGLRAVVTPGALGAVVHIPEPGHHAEGTRGARLPQHPCALGAVEAGWAGVRRQAGDAVVPRRAVPAAVGAGVGHVGAISTGDGNVRPFRAVVADCAGVSC